MRHTDTFRSTFDWHLLAFDSLLDAGISGGGCGHIGVNFLVLPKVGWYERPLLRLNFEAGFFLHESLEISSFDVSEFLEKVLFV